MSIMPPITISGMQFIILVASNLVAVTAFIFTMKSRLDNIEKWIEEHRTYSDNWIKTHEELSRSRESVVNHLASSIAALTETIKGIGEKTNRLEIRLDDTHKLLERRIN